MINHFNPPCSFYETLFQQGVISCKPIYQEMTHYIMLVTLQDGSRWICKQINQSSWVGPLSKEDIEFTQSIAATVEKKLHITYSAHLWENDQYGISCLDETIVCIPYCDGEQLNYWTKKQSFRLGQVLAKIHQLKLSKSQAKPFPEIETSNVNTLPPVLNKCIQECNANRLHGLDDWVSSHRDLHHANVIWQNKMTPYLIDWDSSGLIHPFVELIGLATNCAGIAQGQFAADQFNAVLLGYRQQAKVLPTTDKTLWQLCYFSWLLWLTFNLRQRNHPEVKKTLQSIHLIEKKMSIMQELYSII